MYPDDLCRSDEGEDDGSGGYREDSALPVVLPGEKCYPNEPLTVDPLKFGEVGPHGARTAAARSRRAGTYRSARLPGLKAFPR